VRLICTYGSFRDRLAPETVSRFLHWIDCRGGSHTCAPHPGASAGARGRARPGARGLWIGNAEREMVRMLGVEAHVGVGGAMVRTLG
jgi:hypothetical protein